MENTIYKDKASPFDEVKARLEESTLYADLLWKCNVVILNVDDIDEGISWLRELSFKLSNGAPGKTRIGRRNPTVLYVNSSGEYADMPATDNLIVVRGDNVDLFERFDILENTVAGTGAEFVILDCEQTLFDSMDGSSQKDTVGLMTKLIRLARTRNCCVLLLRENQGEEMYGYDVRYAMANTVLRLKNGNISVIKLP
jgi:hypothetical protein